MRVERRSKVWSTRPITVLADSRLTCATPPVTPRRSVAARTSIARTSRSRATRPTFALERSSTPSSGRPVARRAVHGIISRLRQQGRTVILTTHYIEEAEKLCDRVTIIRKGAAVESGTLTELRHMTRTSIEVTTRDRVSGLDSMPWIHDLAMEGERLVFEVDTAQLGETLAHLAGFGVESLVSQPPTLEELFLRHYGDDLPPQDQVGSGATAAPAAETA